MTDMPSKPPFDFTAIGRIKNIKDVKQWLEQYARDFDKWYKLLYDSIVGGTLAETRNWTIREATATDVTAGKAQAVGDLIVIHNTGGTKHEFEKA